MLRLCVRVISTSGAVRLQQHALTALLAIARCCASDPPTAKGAKHQPNHTTLTQGEAEVILNALRSPATSVREAALQVRKSNNGQLF